MPDFSALRSDLVQLRNDVATATVTLVNAVQPSSPNTPTAASIESQASKMWSVLAADAIKTYQAFVQVENDLLAVMAQKFDILLGIPLPGQSSSPSPSATSNPDSNQASLGASQHPIPAVPPIVSGPTVQHPSPYDPSQTYTTPGSYQWNSPLTGTVTVKLWGGGGGGGGGDSDPGYLVGGSGGGGGGFLQYTTSVVAGNNYTVVVGSGGSGGADITSGDTGGFGSAGGASYFISTTDGEATGGGAGGPNLISFGGAEDKGAPGGSANAPSCSTTYIGGGGGLGSAGGKGVYGGGGGGSAGSGGNGSVGNTGSGSTGGTGGAGGTPDGGSGGNGGGSGNGSNGTVPGGGGGGGSTTGNGGNGASGEVSLSWLSNTPSSSITVSSPGNQTNAEGNTVSLSIHASGGTGSLSFYSSNLPSGLTIDNSTGLISGTIGYTAAEQQGGQYSVTITAYDTTGAYNNTTFTWTVSHTSTTPTLDNPGAQTNWQGDSAALQLSASDVDGDTLTFGATGLPSGVSTNTTTGLISGVLAAPDSGAYSVTASASDGTTTVYQSFTWTVATVKADPVADQSNLLSDSVSVPINAFGKSGQTLTYSATGLPPGLSINSQTGLISGSIANNASVTTPYNVTVTATDGTDPTSTTFAWSISNFTLDNPGAQTNAEGDAVALQSTVETNGTPTLTFSATGLPSGLSINPNTGLIAGTIANLDSNSSPYTVTISATNGTSTSSQTFTWTITHVVLTNPGDQINAQGSAVSLPIQASDPDHDSLTYTASGLPSGLSINTTTGIISGTIASTAGSDTPYSVTVTASDGTHTASATFNWTVTNQKVTVTNPGTQNNAEGANVSLQISASDPSGNGLTYSATGLPAGLQIDSASGLISGTIDGSAAEVNNGVYQVAVLADDGQGNNGSATFTWNVTHTNQAPTLDNPGDQTDQTGDAVSLPLSGYDADGDTVTYSATGLPSGLSINTTTGIISGTLPTSAASSTPYSVTVKASDGTLNASQTVNWFVTTGVVSLTNPGDQTNTDGNNVSLQLSASDSAHSTLTYHASGLPSGLSVNSSSGLISGTITSGDSANAPYTVTITASDALGHSSGQQFIWNVNPVNLNPVVTNPGSQINKQGDVLSLQMQATDPAGNGLTYSATGLPSGLTIDASSGLISGVLSSNSASGSPYNVTVTAKDGTNSGSATFTWSVTNQAVTVTNPGTQNSTVGNAASLQISASDPAHLTLTYAASGLPSGLSINSSTGLISGTLASTDGGAYAVTVMASDSQGNSGSAAFTWNVTYVNQAPTLDNPGDQLDKTGDVVSLPVFGSDVDGDTVTYSATGLPTGLSINSTTGIISGTLAASAASSTPYSVTVTASDGTLHASQTFNWFVTANVVTLTSPGDQTKSEGDNVSLQLSASDSNNSALTYQASGLPSGLSINSSTGLISGTVASGDSANGPYTVTVSATDTQGNSSSQQFTWNVNGVLTLTNPGNQSNAEGNNVSLQVQASDADGDTLEYAASGLPIGLMIDPTTGLISGTVDYSAAEISGGQYNVTVTVNDGNGQTVSKSFVWTIADTPQAPWLQYPGFQDSLSGAAASLQLVGGSPDGKTLTYSATGLPAGLSVNSSTGLISGTITAAMGSYTVTAKATDTSNLSASQTFTWQVPCESAPQVLISFDGQPVGDDYLAGVDPSTPIPVTLTLVNATPGLHTITLSNNPSGESALSKSTLLLANGGSATVQLTPEEESTSFDDDLLVAFVDGKEGGDGKGTNAKVTIAGETIDGHVKNADTPKGMADRIPPRKYTQVAVTVTPTLKDAKVVVFNILNGSQANGEASFELVSGKRVDAGYVQQSQNIEIVGTTQTAPLVKDGKPGGNAGNLRLVAYPGTQKEYQIDTVDKTKQLAISAGFSVAAIPITIKANKPEVAEGKVMSQPGAPNVTRLWGAIYPLEVISDSGVLDDLNEVQISEVIVPDGKETGLYKKYPPGAPIKWDNWTTGDEIDKNGILITGPQGTTLAVMALSLSTDITLQTDDKGKPIIGQSIVDQYFIFSDARTGVPANADGKGAMIVKFSGFKLKSIAERVGGKDFKDFIKVTRTAEGNHGAEAGENASSAEQKAQVKR
jgi:hypothetical protein